MTDEELVDHLLAIDQMSVEDCFCQSTYFIKAADRIKQLTAEREDFVECNEQFSVDNQFLKKRVEKAEADNARLREVVLEADKLLCGDLAGLQWKRECRSFLVLARAVLKGETHD